MLTALYAQTSVALRPLGDNRPVLTALVASRAERDTLGRPAGLGLPAGFLEPLFSVGLDVLPKKLFI